MQNLADDLAIRLSLIMTFQVNEDLQQFQILLAEVFLFAEFGELALIDDGQTFHTEECCLVAAYSDKTCTKPTTALSTDKIYKWTWDNLKTLIGGSR